MCANALGIQLTEASLQYKDSQTPTLAGLSMTIPANQWTVLLGRSGCGKTTILRYLAGLLDDKVEWHGELTTTDGIALHKRIAYMAQQDLLLPWLNVLDNVCLSSRFSQDQAPEQNKQRALTLLSQVGLVDYADAKPAQLSGGMRQRVALARTLMQDKPLVLMDEPFSALDAVNRYKLQNLAAEMLKDKTVVLITHDPQEALRLSDAVYLMESTPVKMTQIPVPESKTPRALDAQMAEIQQSIIEKLGAEHE